MLHLFHSYPPVPAPLIFTYGTSDPSSPSYESSAESVTSKGNPTQHNNTPNTVLNVTAEPDSDPSPSDYSSLGSSDSSDDYYSNQN